MQPLQPVNAPRRLPGVAEIRVCRFAASHPSIGIDLAADGIIEPEDERGQPPVVPAIAEAVDRCGHIRLLAEVRIRLLQHIVQHALPQELHLVFLCHAEIRRQIHRVRIAAQNVRTKSVNG